MRKYELHAHSNMSDGCESPSQVVARASEAGVKLLALSDHDCMLGIGEALEEGARRGVTVLPAIEIDAEFAGEEVHILGLGIDRLDARLNEEIAAQCARRRERLERMAEALLERDIDVRPALRLSGGSVSRVDIALALIRMGLAESVADAFERFLASGRFANREFERMDAGKAVELINGASGVAVLAHPCQYDTDVGELVRVLKRHGLWGVEAYYLDATPEQAARFSALAARCGLFVTCGSDYHGLSRRPRARMGSAFVDNAATRRGYDALVRKLGVEGLAYSD
ncbi:MAG: PHP domain-containing protein [Clostridia bacterium]|nr:PHP domain-containing protein [Clostridia bacterium]